MDSLKEQAYRYIKDLIMNNDLEYGVIYSETKLSKEIHISRTPCRDAIHLLAQEDYIDIIPSKGFCLHKITEKDLNETYQMRSAIECYCTRHLAKHCRDEKAQGCFLRLSELLEQMKNTMEHSHSIDEFWESDQKFHLEIINSIENSMFSKMFEHYMHKITSQAKQSLHSACRMENTYMEHRNILNAMQEGQVEAAVNLTILHMDNQYDINMSYIRSGS